MNVGEGFGARLSGDGRFLATVNNGAIGAPNPTSRLWDVATGSQLGQFAGHTGPLNSVAFSPDSSHVVTSSEDATARISNLSTGNTTCVLTGHSIDVRDAAFSPDGRWL